MAKPAIAAAAFGLVVLVLLALALSRGLTNAPFIGAAYGLTTIVLTGYTWSLLQRLSKARSGDSREKERDRSGPEAN